jgi:hypothetical protein
MRNHQKFSRHWVTRHQVRGGVLAVLGGALLLSAGCSQKDAAKCQQGQEGVKKSVQAGDDALVQQWREYAYKYCEDSALLSSLDREITEKRAADAKRKAEEAKQKAANEQLVALFLKWAGENKAAPERAASNAACEGGEAEEKSQERWCNGTRTAGSHVLSVRYWEKESAAAKFEVKVPQPITCEALGAHRVIRAWTIPNQPIKRFHCEITGGPAAGLQAMVSQAVNAPLHVFSAKYLEMDPGLKTKLTSEGL